MSTRGISLPFSTLLHADWSKSPRKRWVAKATRVANAWCVDLPTRIDDTAKFVENLWRLDGPVLAGFDFPIGLPKNYGAGTGLSGFLAALEVFGTAEWDQFYTVADTPDQISRTRPFYPSKVLGAPKQQYLLQALCVSDMNELRRACEIKTACRPAACPLFWTLGGNQVGKAAISGWLEVVNPARKRGARLWPFDGSIEELSKDGRPVLAETYPAEAYRHVQVNFRNNGSKRKQGDRQLAMTTISEWAIQAGVTFTHALAAQIECGFGSRSTGEDAFDAFVGLLGMVEVVDGRRAAHPPERDPAEVWEGWIFGQQRSNPPASAGSRSRCPV